ncbi:CapA family protein [Paenibacillus sp. CAU 1782]
MTLSRSDSFQQEKRRRKRKRQKRFSLSLITGGAFIVLLGAGIALSGGKLSGLLPFDDGTESSITVDGGQRPNSSNTDLGGGSGGVSDTDAGSGEEQNTDADTENGEGAGTEAAGGEEGAANGSGEGTDDAGIDSGSDDASGTTPDGYSAGSGQAGVEPGDAVSLSFVGDVLPGEYLTALMEQQGYDYPYRQALLYLSEPDIMAGNLEMPVTKRGTPIQNQPYVYKGSPDALPALRDAGFDVLSLATNHAMDQGVEGLLDTIKHLDEAGLGHMGTGNNDKEAFAPHIIETKGIKVAYIGLSHVIPLSSLKADRNTPGIAETYDTTRATAAIKSAKEAADIVVVMVHWGKDGMDKPVDSQKSLAKAYIDAGADLIVGSHPHVLQGFEMYKGKWIAYSLGNFVFTAYPKDQLAETGVLDALCSKDGECSLTFNPMKVTVGQPTPMTGEEAETLLRRLTSISYGASLDSSGKISGQNRQGEDD